MRNRPLYTQVGRAMNQARVLSIKHGSRIRLTVRSTAVEDRAYGYGRWAFYFEWTD